MTKAPASGPLRTGLLRPRDHCTFTWTQGEGEAERTVVVRRDHCLQCVARLRRGGHRLVSEDGSEQP